MKITKLCFLAGLMFIACLSLKATDQNTNTPTVDNTGHHHKGALEQLYSLRIGNGWGFVDVNNKVVIPGYFDDAEDFSEGLGQFKIADKWGFVNRNGKIIIPPMYDYSTPFAEGLSAVCKRDKWGYIDTEGKVKIDFFYKIAGDFHESLAYVSETGKKDSFGFINKNGKYVIPTGVYDDAKLFSEGLAAVKDNDKWGYINTQGKILIPLAYEEAQTFSNGLAAVRSNGKWGYIDKHGKTVIKFEYDYASLFTDSGAIVSKNEESLILNHSSFLISDTGKSSDINQDKNILKNSSYPRWKWVFENKVKNCPWLCPYIYFSHDGYNWTLLKFGLRPQEQVSFSIGEGWASLDVWFLIYESCPTEKLVFSGTSCPDTKTYKWKKVRFHQYSLGSNSIYVAGVESDLNPGLGVRPYIRIIEVKKADKSRETSHPVLYKIPMKYESAEIFNVPFIWSFLEDRIVRIPHESLSISSPSWYSGYTPSDCIFISLQ